LPAHGIVKGFVHSGTPGVVILLLEERSLEALHDRQVFLNVLQYSVSHKHFLCWHQTRRACSRAVSPIHPAGSRCRLEALCVNVLNCSYLPMQ
jgi:hypothetical protein